jgi:SAM-dependent methyltransferase
MTKRLDPHSCEVCGAATVAWFHPKTAVRYDACPSCDHIRRDPSLDPSPPEEKEQYDLHENSPDNQGYVRFLRRFADRSLRPFLKNGHVLDLGSGPTPVFSGILSSEYGYEVTSYDPIYHKNPRAFDQTYDAVIMSEVIEHVHDIQALLERLGQILRPGGILAVMTLFRPESKDDFFTWWYIRDETHVRFFNRNTFQTIAGRHGYDILDCDGTRKITLRKT